MSTVFSDRFVVNEKKRDGRRKEKKCVPICEICVRIYVCMREKERGYVHTVLAAGERDERIALAE